jgi:putative membrane protein insertion efficiency factor
MRALALALIRLYQVALGPHMGGSCRHLPSCSAYAREAIARHGVRRGTLLALKRVARCHPLGTHGYDPVP